MKNNNNFDVLWIDFVNLDIEKLQINKYNELYEDNVLTNWLQYLIFQNHWHVIGRDL